MSIAPAARRSAIGRGLVARLATLGPVQRALFALRRARRPDEPVSRIHPFDVAYGVRTSGTLPAWLLRSGAAADAHSTAYAGCQPSCLRAALRSIPNLDQASFFDLGCGLGRAMIVASEFPLAGVRGVELSPALATGGRRNVRRVAARHAGRPVMTVDQGDASQAPLPAGRLVVFLYHSFGPALVERVARRVLEHVRDGGEVFFVYENPVHGAVLDGMAGYTRWFAAFVAYDPQEQGFGPEDGEAIIVWRAGTQAAGPAAPGADRPIVITKPGWRAELG